MYTCILNLNERVGQLAAGDGASVDLNVVRLIPARQYPLSFVD